MDPMLKSDHFRAQAGLPAESLSSIPEGPASGNWKPSFLVGFEVALGLLTLACLVLAALVWWQLLRDLP